MLLKDVQFKAKKANRRFKDWKWNQGKWFSWYAINVGWRWYKI